MKENERETESWTNFFKDNMIPHKRCIGQNSLGHKRQRPPGGERGKVLAHDPIGRWKGAG